MDELFLGEYKFEVIYSPGKENAAVYILSREPRGDVYNEKDGDTILCPTLEMMKQENLGFEPNLSYVKGIFLGNYGIETRIIQINAIKRSSKIYLVWEDNLFRRTQSGPKEVVPISDRVRVIKFFHDSTVHW